MKIKISEFVISNTDVAKCPQEELPEYAFIGRSNVGKSSLINCLVARKELAKISGKPGKTQCINHFKIDKAWFLVDLPGYGYAQVSKTKRETFQLFIKKYFLTRQQLVCSFVLVDSRHPPQKIDLAFMRFLGEHQIPFSIIFTKTDKLPSAKLDKQINAYKEVLLTDWETVPTHFITSAITGSGRAELLTFIQGLNKKVATNFK